VRAWARHAGSLCALPHRRSRKTSGQMKSGASPKATMGYLIFFLIFFVDVEWGWEGAWLYAKIKKI